MDTLKFGGQYVRLPIMESKVDERSEDETIQKSWANRMVWLVAIAAAAFFAGAIFGAELNSTPMRSITNMRASHQVKSFVPEIPSKSITFSLKSALMGPPGPESDKAWEDLIPVGYGFVNISNPEMFDLPPGVEAESGPDTYSVAMFHQIHCLTHIRDRYWLLVNTILDPKYIQQVQPEIEKEIHNHHTQHCLEYLAQSISCSADLTIEWARVDKNGSRIDVDGGNIPHVCKDPDAIWSWMEANHAAPSEQSHRHVHLANLLSG